MKECTSGAVWRNLPFCKGNRVLAGIRTRIYYIAKRDIVSWPALPSETTGKMGLLAEYSGNFHLAADKKWQYIDLVDNKGKIESESQGEYPARTFINKTSLTHPGTDYEATGFARQANADDFVYLIQQRLGKFRVIGCRQFPTDTKPKTDTGEGTQGDFGTTLDISCTDICPAPFYGGLIETELGYIDGATGMLYTKTFDSSFDSSFR